MNYTILRSVNGGGQKELQEFASDVLTGLSQRVKSIPSKYFYDERGSELFRKIMDLPEYYLTNSEMEILKTHGEKICEVVCKKGMNVVELGAGDGLKTRILLEQLLDRDISFSYNPIDISESAVRGLSEDLLKSLPKVQVHGIVAEYFDGIRWLSDREHCGSLVLFLGSNIGNFHPAGTENFLSSLWNAMDEGDHLLIGFDLKKDSKVVSAAYDDPAGVTEEFNFNLLRRINNELGGEFDPDGFVFNSIWNPREGAIQSFLVSTRRQSVHIRELNRTFEFGSWEPIHTESSYKFTPEMISHLARRIGFEVVGEFTDSKGYFMNSLWRVIK